MILTEIRLMGREFVLEYGQFDTHHWGFDRHDERNWTLHLGKLSLVQSTLTRYEAKQFITTAASRLALAAVFATALSTVPEADADAEDTNGPANYVLPEHYAKGTCRSC